MRHCLIALALIGCGKGDSEAVTPLSIENLTVTVSGLNQAVLRGEIVLQDEAGVGGTDASATFYSDDYISKIASTPGVLGLGLTEVGDRESFELTSIQARLVPHDDGYMQVCVDLIVANTPFETGTQVGCVDGVPDPTTPTTTTTTPPDEEPPTAEIYEPFELELFGIGETMDLDGRCRDVNQSDGSLTAEWTQQEAAGAETALVTDPIEGNGDTHGEWPNPPIGDYVIRLRCTDDNNTSDVASRNVSVVDRQLTDLDGDGYTPATGDCNDSAASIHPNAEELCDNIDQNCNTVIDDRDEDGDGHIDEACTQYVGALPRDDCDDSLADVYPGATETCDAVDQNCNGITDDRDLDADGYIDEACTAYDGGLTNDDCDDDDAGANPGEIEIPANGTDEDCDGLDL